MPKINDLINQLHNGDPTVINEIIHLLHDKVAMADILGEITHEQLNTAVSLLTPTKHKQGYIHYNPETNKVIITDPKTLANQLKGVLFNIYFAPIDYVLSETPKPEKKNTPDYFDKRLPHNSPN